MFRATKGSVRVRLGVACGGAFRAELLKPLTPGLKERVYFVFLNFQPARTNTFIKSSNSELLEKWSCDARVSKCCLSVSVPISPRTSEKRFTDGQQAARHPERHLVGNGQR